MRIHLGCGKRYLAGYVHVDSAPFDHVDHVRDVRDLGCFADSCASLIYASHLFEYFDRIEAVAALAEWRRVLRPGGVLRLAVPDFAALVAVYRETGSLDRVIGPLYGRWPIPGTDITVYHKTIYDAQTLAAMLCENNFHDPRLWDWKEVFTGDNLGFDDYSQAYYPHMDKEHGRLISLNMEATKKQDCQ